MDRIIDQHQGRLLCLYVIISVDCSSIDHLVEVSSVILALSISALLLLCDGERAYKIGMDD